MNVIDLSFYRRKKEIENLEQRMAALAQKPHGTVKEMKATFREWLVKTSSQR